MLKPSQHHLRHHQYDLCFCLSRRQADSERGLRAVHSRFYLSDTPIGVAIVGPGLIGGTLIDQIAEQAAQLRSEFNIDIRVLGIASSSKMLLSESGVDLSKWKQEFADKVSARAMVVEYHLR